MTSGKSRRSRRSRRSIRNMRVRRIRRSRRSSRNRKNRIREKGRIRWRKSVENIPGCRNLVNECL